MQKLLTSDNRVQIYLFKSKLESENIPCFISNEYPPAAGEITSVVAPMELWVLNDHQYDLALEILKKEAAQLHAWHAPWICPQCGERLEGQFTGCWKCGYEKSAL